MKPKAALIVDNLKLARWEKNTLIEASDKVDIVCILNCKNTANKRNLFKNFFYYILNFLSLRNFLTEKVTLDSFDAEIISFDSIYSGSWHSIPIEVTQKLKHKKINLIIKFGMGLLKIPDDLNDLTLLSFHHGDPSKYRGRPAGFYEILNNEPTNGIIIQKLTNELDAGKVLAFSESKVINYSYKKSAINFYTNSQFMLSKAIDSFLENEFIEIKSNGKNYSLPTNFIVFKFFLLVIKNAIKRIFYGLFFEKKWKVAIKDKGLPLKGSFTINPKDLFEIPISKGYSFFADPFYSLKGDKIRVEALRSKTGLGDILEIPVKNLKKSSLLFSGNHYSYPYSFSYNNKEYLLPEVASHSAQFFEEIQSNANEAEKFFLKGLEDLRILDATLIEYNSFWYLFFGQLPTEDTILNLWVSDDPYGIFTAHPKSPISMSPKNSRMGGSIINYENALLRVGQNNANGYGESLVVHEITELSPTDFQEIKIGTIKINEKKGPHSLNFDPLYENMLIDYYEEHFSLFAGLRRIKAMIARK